MFADLVLLLHVLIVAFNVLALPAIWVGAWRGWRWIRWRGLRLTHLLLMLFIAAEAVLGVVCPLTLWEDALRGTASERGFLSRWLAAVLYWDWPAWVFTALYSAWLVLIAITWWLVPPRPSESRST